MKWQITDRLIIISYLKKILFELGLWNQQIEDRLEKYKETGL